MTKREKIATILGLFADKFPGPSLLEPETRVLIGLPEHLPRGGYGYDREDVKIRAVESLAQILTEEP